MVQSRIYDNMQNRSEIKFSTIQKSLFKNYKLSNYELLAVLHFGQPEVR